jgi:hypothetical protein
LTSRNAVRFIGALLPEAVLRAGGQNRMPLGTLQPRLRHDFACRHQQQPVGRQEVRQI